MRLLDPSSTEYLSAHTGVASRHMIHVVARNRATGAQEALGLWQGDDHLTIAIGGVNRIYYGAGTLIGVEPIRAGIGLEVRMLQLALSPLTPEVALMLRGYDARLAPAEIHRGLLSLQTGQLIAEPIRVFRGWVDEVKIRTGAVAGLTVSVIRPACKARLLPGPAYGFGRQANSRGASFDFIQTLR